MKNKIKSINALAKRIKKLKADGKKVVHCHGVFDLIHVGHIKHFEEAKSYGDILVVTITPDKFVNKGPDRPAFVADLRLQALASLEVIDYVCINKWSNSVETIKLIQPDIYCKGPDYKNHSDDITGKISEEENAVISIGGKIKYTEDITFSSSSLINKYGNIYSQTQKSFIESLSINNKIKSIKDDLHLLKNLKVLIIGETIIDQYVFCEALGKSGKEPVLVLRDINMDQYAGGALAIARHLSDFCDKISILTMLGENKDYLDFVSESLANNISPYFIFKTGAPTITKKRYVDKVSKSKSLGVYSINDTQMNKKDQNELKKNLLNLIPKHDIIIVTDYGHGFISGDIAKYISKQSVFTSLNAQINAANIGYHTMNNYNNIDCAIINEGELRHEMRDRETDIKKLMKKLTISLELKILVVTQGNNGATLYSADNKKYYHCPAFASKVVDKIGSGDAMLALLSCALKSGFNPDLALFIGSLAAAQSVETIGNSSAVNKKQLIKTFNHSLK
tara:strand:+ start:1098 stop:2621 length:1524 start_codon:yes stop_codon:yes gene_type:complete